MYRFEFQAEMFQLAWGGYHSPATKVWRPLQDNYRWNGSPLIHKIMISRQRTRLHVTGKPTTAENPKGAIVAHLKRRYKCPIWKMCDHLEMKACLICIHHYYNYNCTGACNGKWRDVTVIPTIVKGCKWDATDEMPITDARDFNSYYHPVNNTWQLSGPLMNGAAIHTAGNTVVNVMEIINKNKTVMMIYSMTAHKWPGSLHFNSCLTLWYRPSNVNSCSISVQNILYSFF